MRDDSVRARPWRPILAWVESVANVVAAASLALVALITAATVTLRAFGANVPDAIDFSGFFMGVMIFWGIAAAFRNDNNVRVDLLLFILPQRTEAAIRIFGNFVAAAFMILLAIAGFQHVDLVLRSREVTPELRIDLWPFNAVAWIGLALAALMASMSAIDWPRKPRSGNEPLDNAAGSSPAQNKRALDVD
ncbi:MAG: TRAP transporter small permease [Pseudomonadota bacterium]